jgi:hypothetical protein
MKTKQAVGHRIANQVCRDFAEGIVVCVDGWLLSLTEARLYALASLSVWGFDDDSHADGTSAIL